MIGIKIGPTNISDEPINKSQTKKIDETRWMSKKRLDIYLAAGRG